MPCCVAFTHIILAVMIKDGRQEWQDECEAQQINKECNKDRGDHSVGGLFGSQRPLKGLPVFLAGSQGHLPRYGVLQCRGVERNWRDFQTFAYSFFPSTFLEPICQAISQYCPPSQHETQKVCLVICQHVYIFGVMPCKGKPNSLSVP